MTAVSQIREALSIGTQAKSGIFTPDAFVTWARNINDERAASAPRTDIPRFSGTGETEWSRLSSIYNQVRLFGENGGIIEGIFGNISDIKSERR